MLLTSLPLLSFSVAAVVVFWKGRGRACVSASVPSAALLLGKASVNFRRFLFPSTISVAPASCRLLILHPHTPPPPPPFARTRLLLFQRSGALVRLNDVRARWLRWVKKKRKHHDLTKESIENYPILSFLNL